MKLLAIDRGNSRTKVGLLHEDSTNLKVTQYSNEDIDGLLAFCASVDFEGAIISSVASQNLDELIALLHDKSKLILMDHTTLLPVKNSYTTPETLGTDRLAGAIGAWKLVGNKNVLLVDCGTCVNYECIVDNSYLGGAIAPGLQMRLKSMHSFTGQLPLVVLPNEEVKVTGNSTETCLQSGAARGLAFEIMGVYQHYSELFDEVEFVISGGDAIYLGKYLKNSIFAPHKDVVLTGLIEILKHNLNV